MTRLHVLLTVALAFALSPRATFAQVSPPSADPSQYLTADSLWLHIQDLKKAPQSRPASQDEYRAFVTEGMSRISAATNAFLNRYPDDPRKWDARMLQLQAASMLDQVSGHPGFAAQRDGLLTIANAPDAPSSIRAEARFQLFGMSMQDYMRGATTAANIVAQLDQFISDFPTYPQLDVIKFKVAEALDKNDPAAGNRLLAELASSGQGQIADLAKGRLALDEKLKSPLDLRFTAVDGAPVDLSALRGKVVLLDFWATWCGPCRAKLPEVISVYNDLHEKGFEVIGISLDHDKDALLRFTAQNGMPWPQYFDGKGWQNSISSSFAIQSIPTMWLINKKGFVVSTSGQQGLEDQVERLLAADSK